MSDNLSKNNTNNYMESLVIDAETREKIRLLELKNSFDQGLIAEENISESDKEALIKLYDEEMEKLKIDTENNVNKIKKILGV